MTYSYKPIVPDPELIDPGKSRPKAVVIGAGLGGLSAAMRLGSKGLILGLQSLPFQKFLKSYGRIVVILLKMMCISRLWIHFMKLGGKMVQIFVYLKTKKICLLK